MIETISTALTGIVTLLQIGIPALVNIIATSITG